MSSCSAISRVVSYLATVVTRTGNTILLMIALSTRNGSFVTVTFAFSAFACSFRLLYVATFAAFALRSWLSFS